MRILCSSPASPHCAIHFAPARLDDLGARFGLSVRQLERRFDDGIGLSPKQLASILRFRALFDALAMSKCGASPDGAGDGRVSPRAPWLAAAIEAGYFDQAHMIRDFKRFAGASPQAFIRSLAGLSAALVEKTGTDHVFAETGDRP